MANVVIFGTGRGADVAYRVLSKDSDHKIVAFTVDNQHLTTHSFHGLPVVPFEDVQNIYPPDDFQMLVLLGYQAMNSLRKEKYNQGKQKGYRFISYLNSSIFCPEPLSIGENCFIFDNQSISLDVKIGNNVVMWSSNHIGDCTDVLDHAWISSSISIAGYVVIGKSSFLGINSTIINRVRLGEATFVGAHTLISEDTEDNSVHTHQENADTGVTSSQFMRIMMTRGKL